MRSVAPNYINLCESNDIYTNINICINTNIDHRHIYTYIHDMHTCHILLHRGFPLHNNRDNSSCLIRKLYISVYVGFTPDWDVFDILMQISCISPLLFMKREIQKKRNISCSTFDSLYEDSGQKIVLPPGSKMSSQSIGRFPGGQREPLDNMKIDKSEGIFYWRLFNLTRPGFRRFQPTCVQTAPCV